MTSMQITKIVDQYGELKRQIAEAEEKALALRQILLSANISEVDGRFYRAVVYRSESDRVDWKAVVESQRPTPALKGLITKNTMHTETVSLKVTPV